MQTGIKLYVLANVESGPPDEETGDRLKIVSRAKAIVNRVELVGVNTAQVGQLQGYNLAFSVKIPRILYDSEKYLFFDEKIYEIKSQTKAKKPMEMILNVQASSDLSAARAVARWISENIR